MEYRGAGGIKSGYIGKVVIGLAITLLLIVPTIVHAEGQKIRVVVENASIRSGPDMTSRVIESPPFGSVFEVQKKVGEWYEIEFASKVGVLVTGYIHEMFVEADNEISEPPRTAKRRAFSLSLSYGRIFPTGHMRSDLSLAPGPKFGIAGEYFLNPRFGIGLHYMHASCPVNPGSLSDWPILHMVGAHGKLVLVRQGNARPYALLGSGIVMARPKNSIEFWDSGVSGVWHAVSSIDTRPYIFLGGGLDYSVFPQVSLFGELTVDFLLWRGAALHSYSYGDGFVGIELPIRKLDQEYFFYDLAAGVRINLGAYNNRR